MEYIFGVIVSLLVQWVKQAGGLKSTQVIITLLVGSILAATIFTFFKDSSWWAVGMQILVTASAFHNLILKRFLDFDVKIN
jgi:hypothetical protein